MAKETAAERHLRASDKVMRGLIEAGGPIDAAARRRGRPKDAYGALLRAISGQQLSTKAASTIWGRVEELFGGRTPLPKELLAIDPEKLRGAGLSWSKVSYMRDLAERIEDGRLHLGSLAELSDDEVIAELTEIKGIGQWTAEMFLMFHLNRPDMISCGDLGIRRAVEVAYGLEELPDPEELTRIAEPWRPYRTRACLYLWRSLDNAPA